MERVKGNEYAWMHAVGVGRVSVRYVGVGVVVMVIQPTANGNSGRRATNNRMDDDNGARVMQCRAG